MSTNVIADFAKGFISGAHDGDASVAQVIGDFAGALTPGVGQAKGIQDLYEGVRRQDAGMLVNGLIQCIPYAGGAMAAGEKVAGQVAKKGLTKTAAQYSALAERSARQVLKNPETRKKLAAAAEDAGQIALAKLVERLSGFGEGEVPNLIVRDHSTWTEARTHAEQGMGDKPNKKWFDMRDDSSGRELIVGRHQINGDYESERGMRWFKPEADGDPMHLAWWNNTNPENPKFGFEGFKASSAQVDRIMEAYLMGSKSFRSAVRSS